MLEFFNYSYKHVKYQVSPSKRDSTKYDPISELDIYPIKKWNYGCEETFAKAKIEDGKLVFIEVNKKVVDEKHLTLESLISSFIIL